jgi:hypothetical protein
MLTLLVLGLDALAGQQEATEQRESLVRDCGSSGRSYKSALIFTVPDASEAARDWPETHRLGRASTTTRTQKGRSTKDRLLAATA